MTKPLTVKDLIVCLQNLPQDLPVYWVMFDDGYNTTALTEEDIKITVLENCNGDEFKTLTIGEEWLS